MRPKDPDHLDDAVTVKHAAYREAIQRVVDDDPRVVLGVNFYPLLDPATDFVDVHPNQSGHNKMATALFFRLIETGVIFAPPGSAACGGG
jgi:hypothetical protein